MCTCVHAYMRVHVRSCMRACVHAFLCACMCTCSVCVQGYTCVRVCMRIAHTCAALVCVSLSVMCMCQLPAQPLLFDTVIFQLSRFGEVFCMQHALQNATSLLWFHAKHLCKSRKFNHNRVEKPQGSFRVRMWRHAPGVFVSVCLSLLSFPLLSSPLLVLVLA